MSTVHAFIVRTTWTKSVEGTRADNLYSFDYGSTLADEQHPQVSPATEAARTVTERWLRVVRVYARLSHLSFSSVAVLGSVAGELAAAHFLVEFD
jgi:hypothetical protein